MKQYIKTQNNGELVSLLPLNGAKQVIFSIPVVLNENDVIVALAETEMTNLDIYNIGVFTQLILSVTSNGTTGLEVSEANGRNITKNMHHDTHSKNGTLQVPSNGQYYLNLIAWCVSTSATKDIRVESDYGHLSCIVL